VSLTFITECFNFLVSKKFNPGIIIMMSI
jgi:hypothetical protein